MKTISEQIISLVEEAMSDLQSCRQICIGVVSTEFAGMVKEELHRCIYGYKLMVDADLVRHVLKNRHTNMSVFDFLALPIILKKPGSVSPGNKANTIKINKTLGKEYRCIEVIVDKRKLLRLKTFFIPDPPKTMRKGNV